MGPETLPDSPCQGTGSSAGRSIGPAAPEVSARWASRVRPRASQMQAAERLFPCLPIWTHQHRRSLAIAGDLLGLGIPSHAAPQAERDVGEMASDGGVVAIFYV